MREKIYYFIIFIFLAFACFLLVGGKFKNIGRNWTVDWSKYGDLYIPSLLINFKEEIVRKESEPATDIETAKIIVVGDSFSYGRLNSDRLSVLIENQTGLKTADLSSGDPYPLVELAKQKFSTSTPRWLILETIERLAVKRTSEYSKDPKLIVVAVKKKKLIDVNVFHHEEMDYFFKYNKILFPFVSVLRNIRFALTGQIDALIGAVSNNPPLLFSIEETIFNRDLSNADKVLLLAQNVKELEGILKKKYNINLLVVVVPNKYSVYSEWDRYYSYNNYIPKLNVELDKTGTQYIDLYSIYKKYREVNGDSELLYFSSDSHYAPLGKQLLVDELVKVLK